MRAVCLALCLAVAGCKHQAHDDPGWIPTTPPKASCSQSGVCVDFYKDDFVTQRTKCAEGTWSMTACDRAPLAGGCVMNDGKLVQWTVKREGHEKPDVKRACAESHGTFMNVDGTTE